MPGTGGLIVGAWDMTVLECALVFLAGAMRGFTGFGFSLAAVPLLSLVMPPSRAVPVVVILQCGLSVMGLRDAARQCDWRSVRFLALGAVFATPLGAWALAHLAAAPVRLVIAVIVTLGSVVLVGGGRLASLPGGWRVLPFGVAAGLFNGLAGMPGPPVIAFYLASPSSSDVARASMIVFFLLTSILAMASLAWLGLLSQANLAEAALGLPAVLLGSWLGARAFRKSTERLYPQGGHGPAARDGSAVRLARALGLPHLAGCLSASLCAAHHAAALRRPPRVRLQASRRNGARVA